MCNDLNCSHDLDDGLDDIFGDDIFASPTTDADRKAGLDLARAQPVRVTHEERCPSCRGSGRFVSYSGRTVGDCFKCRGKGVLTFRTSVAQRERATELRNQRKEREQMNIAEQAEAWKRANPNEASWLFDAAQRGFEFAVAMEEALLKYGHLTEKQEAAVRNATAKWIERRAQWAAERAEREASTAAIDISRIAEALATAKRNLIMYPKLRLADFVFSLAPDTGRNSGSIYVKSSPTKTLEPFRGYVKQDGVYLGKIAEGRFSRSRDCDATLEAAIVAAAADPEAAASAYGLQTGICSCCGRKLTNAESVGLGIGPICRSKWGW
jgi:thiaminase